MKQDLLFLWINAGLYITLVVYYIKKIGLDFRTFPLLLWACSSVACIVYYTHPYRSHSFHDTITLFPFFYLFILIWISFVPLLRFNRKKIHSITINQNVFLYVSIIIITFSLLTLYPNISYYLNHMTSTESYLEQYEDKMNGESIVIMSDGLARFMRYCKYFRGVVGFFFVLSFTHWVKKNLYIRWGLFIAWINLIISFLNTASRFALYTDFIFLVFLYLLLKDAFVPNIKKKIKIFSLLIGGFLFSLVLIMTIARFGENSGYTKSLDYIISLYAGESFVNFNGDMWSMPQTADGENCIGPFIHKIQGEDDINRDYQYLERLVHRRMNVYYTFIGDYYTDFGRMGTIILVVFFSWLFTILTKPHKTTSIASFILLAMYSKILLLGFTYWTYLNFTFEIIGDIIVVILFYGNKSKRYDFHSDGNI